MTRLVSVPASSLRRALRASARRLVLAALLVAPLALGGQVAPRRPFGTLREQADIQQRWLEQRLKTVLPALMRKHGVDAWVIPMREYNEDPVFSSLVSPTTFAARRRTIYLFFDRCAAAGRTDPGDGSCVERIAFGGTSQGGLYEARRAMKAVEADVGGRQAELWGDEQWQVLKAAIDERNPRVIAINTSRTFAFTDGLSSGERDGMTEAVGPAHAARFRPAEALALDLIATRLPEEVAFYDKLQALVWELSERMFSNAVVRPGVTRTSDLVWWWRQQVNDLGLGTWFQPSIEVQRRGVADVGEDPIIQRGDVLHSDVGITALGLNTDTQHNAYVLLPGETQAPAGLTAALRNANRLQDIQMEEIRPGKSGNQVLAASRARMAAAGIDGTFYSHPIGKHGHGSGPIIGLWDYQDGVPGRGDALIVPNMWYSIELQATTPVPEWGGQKVRMAQEEDMVMGADGVPRWAIRRQDRLFLVR
ncbi:MAG: M24 family metallopeptidase [Gemmatimonadota bacterium]|jgi:Xaa-Pro aminopeptidase|nr:M24 family metallopeptidase [Gemmatimonadota bacterium]MDQ8146357.1 M24 family metallopeptidase [Gemmatimonadota bacterium]MDQ8148293.1 M24 family metallopeptidase [Gemmatimonadota bacterium]MDQ8155865.1 M24 family metallopeptidase [Gemmatimonadota bacterium]MDQ8175830.1 M24 family metallopeptidase [Gemmatimonadota bacterium]